jgi:hypothetical protein
MNYEREVELARELAEEAGRLAMDFQRKGVVAEEKIDESPVTAADRACEKLIVSRLAEKFPGDGFLGEEGANAESSNGRKWIIDPIDGTRDFVRGIPLWDPRMYGSGAGCVVVQWIQQGGSQPVRQQPAAMDRKVLVGSQPWWSSRRDAGGHGTGRCVDRTKCSAVGLGATEDFDRRSRRRI